jgi:prepilin-type processing-associated H-X9-DG protein
MHKRWLNISLVVTLSLALALLLRQHFIQAREDARTASCQANMKGIALGLLRFASDHQQRFALTARWFQTAYPRSAYGKSEAIFRCPADENSSVPAHYSYAFNPFLEGVALSKIADLASTVMIYEGKNRQLDFRHRGGANVGFADGHIKLIHPQEAKSLRWKP